MATCCSQSALSELRHSFSRLGRSSLDLVQIYLFEGVRATLRWIELVFIVELPFRAHFSSLLICTGWAALLFYWAPRTPRPFDPVE